MQTNLFVLAPIVLLLSGINSQPAAAATTAAAKDVAAVSALTRMAQATGWIPGKVPSDAVLTGTLNRAGTQETLNLSYKVRGTEQLRSDIQGSGGLSTTILNRGQGLVTLPEGTSRPILFAESASIWSVLLPFFSPNLSSAITTSGVALSYLGKESVNSASCDKVRITQLIDPADPLTSIKGLTSTLIVWVDTKSGLPTQIQYTRTASDNQTATTVHVRQFSNFQTVNNLLVPFTQTEFVNGSLVARIQLTGVSFNVGLTDTDFALPTN